LSFFAEYAHNICSRNYMTSPGRFASKRALPFFAVCLVFAFLAASVVSKLSAYVLTGASWPSGSTVTFQMALGNAGHTLTDGNSSFDVAASPAGAAWNQSVQRVRLSMSTNPSASISQGDGLNSVAFSSSFFGNSFGSNTLAMTGWSTHSGVTVEADVLFNNHLTWDSYRGALRFGSNGFAIGEIRRVLIHELGHAIGLNHPDSAGQHVSAIMNSVVSGIEMPTADDISGAQVLYGAPTSNSTPTPTPTPIPTPTPTPTPIPTPTPTPTPTATPLMPTLTLVASPTLVRTGGNATFTVTSSFAQTTPTAVIFTMGGKAAEGFQYSINSNQFTIPAGATSANVTLSVIKGGKRAKSAIMTLSGASNYTLSPARSAIVTITR